LAEAVLATSLLLVSSSNLISNAIGLLLIVVARERGASPELTGVILALVAVGSLAGHSRDSHDENAHSQPHRQGGEEP